MLTAAALVAVRVGWAPGQADKDLPCGCEANSYSYRDVEGTKVAPTQTHPHTLFELDGVADALKTSAPRLQFNAARPGKYGEAFTTGDVIGCYIKLPNRGANAQVNATT